MKNLWILLLIPFLIGAAPDRRISDNDGHVLDINSNGSISATVNITSGGGGITADTVTLNNGDLTLENAETISNSSDGIICLGGAGQTNNENICFDTETTNNRVILNSTTGGNSLRVSYSAGFIIDGGSGVDSLLIGQTAGSDNFIYRADVSAAQLIFAVDDDVGNQYVITNQANNNKDHDHATQTNPTLFIHSDKNPDTANDEWISFTHDSGTGRIQVGTGGLDFDGEFTADSVTLENGEIISNATNNQIDLFTGADVADASDGKKLIINRKAAEGDDQLEFYIDQFRGSHIEDDTQQFTIQAGNSRLNLIGAAGVWMNEANGKDVHMGNSVSSIDIEGAVVFGQGVTADSVEYSQGYTADPCGGMNAGTIFWNSVAAEHCVCNGSNDLRIKDYSTACF